MAFNWDQYQQMPTTGGVTGNGSVNPSQLSMAPPQASYAPDMATFGEVGNATTMPVPWPSGTPFPASAQLPYGGSPNVSFDPSQAAPSNPMLPGNNPVSPNLQPTTTTSGGDPQAYFNSLFPGPSLSPQELMAHEADLKAHGITLIKNAAGLPSKIQLPDGTVVDPIIGAGSGQNQKAWNVVAGPGGAPTGGGPLSGSSMGNLGYSYGSSMAPWNEQFSAPTQEQALNTPGVQFGLEEANRMMQNSAAAKGTLLNGRFQQALAASNIGNAMQQYGDVYNRGLNEYLLKRDNFYQNQDRPFNKNLSLAQLGKPT